MARPADSAPTLATVAAEAGVSRQTVSNALNSPDLLRPETLERVQEAIGRLGYSPNRAARNLRTRTSSLIGLRFAPAQEGTANAAMDRFVHSLVEASEGVGYHVLLFPGDDEDPVGQAEHFLDLAGHDDDGDTVVSEAPDEGVDLGARTDVDAAGGLVEDEHAAAAQQPSGEDDLLLVAAGQRAHLAVDPGRAHVEALDLGHRGLALAGAVEVAGAGEAGEAGDGDV